MVTRLRHMRIMDSNNKTNPNKNICALHVAAALGVANRVTYLHTVGDLFRAVRKSFSCRSVKSGLKGKTVGAIRQELAVHDKGALVYIVVVDDHVLLLDEKGKTVVDTAPQKRDGRKVELVYGVYIKKPRARRVRKYIYRF